MINNKAAYLHSNTIPRILDHLKSHKCGPMAWSHYKWVQRELDMTYIKLIPIQLKPTLTVSLDNYPLYIS